MESGMSTCTAWWVVRSYSAFSSSTSAAIGGDTPVVKEGSRKSYPCRDRISSLGIQGLLLHIRWNLVSSSLLIKCWVAQGFSLDWCPIHFTSFYICVLTLFPWLNAGPLKGRPKGTEVDLEWYGMSHYLNSWVRAVLRFMRVILDLTAKSKIRI